jgi:penicillin-binding protein 2
MPILYVVKGKTEDGSTLYDTHEPMYTRVFSESTAKTLQEFMNRSVQYNTASNGVPCNTTAGGKTSTAQTGKYGEDGVEVCQSWITGYFPCDNPKYAVTVLVEDGGYGNVTSAPIFKRIIELVTAYSL